MILKTACIAQKINADCVPYFVTIGVMVGQTNAVQRGTKTRVVNSAVCGRKLVNEEEVLKK